MSTPTIRTEAEVQRAHDILVGLILDECPPELRPTEEQRAQLASMASVLCWMLHHDHNTSFAELLAGIEKAANDLGTIISGPGEN